MAGACDDTADPHRASELGSERVGDIVLLKIAGLPAGDIKKTVVHRQIDIVTNGGTALNPFEYWRKLVGIGRFGRGFSIIFLTAQRSPSRRHTQIDESLRLTTQLTKP
jgi:hypothetical protein